jgi:ketosteroid isomerase-like protein
MGHATGAPGADNSTKRETCVSTGAAKSRRKSIRVGPGCACQLDGHFECDGELDASRRSVGILPIMVVASPADDEKTVATLDTQYQAAVEKNDADTMDRILADDFVLVTGLGKTYTKTDLLKSARSKGTVYEHQEDSSQKVRAWGDTAVVTALLWLEGTEDGKPFDYKLWFSDTHARTPIGWRYVFGQASTRLPKTP